MEWIENLFNGIKSIVDFFGGLVPAGLGVLFIGAFTFLVALAVKRAVI